MVTSKSRFVTLLSLLLISSIVLVASLSALSFFDPLAKEDPALQKPLKPMPISPESKEIRWLQENLPQPTLSVRVTAGYGSGDLDSAYGILLGQGNKYFAIMISPLGYVSIWEQSASTEGETEIYHIPWQTWPHIRTGDSQNEIFVNLDGDSLSVRINREWLWETRGVDRVDRVGIIGESYGGDVSIDFKLAEISGGNSAETAR